MEQTTTMEITTSGPTVDRYLEPGWFTRNVFNRVVRVAHPARRSASAGSRELRVRGRKTGEWRTTSR